MTNINGTESDDTLNNAETETVDMISGGGGDDIITNSGTVNNFIEGGSGDDIITNNVDGLVESIDGGEFTGFGFAGADSDIGNDTVINFGTVGIITEFQGLFGDIHVGPGDDTIRNEESGTANGLFGGAGDDLIINFGTTVMGINGGEGNDTLINSGTVGFEINGRQGDDIITNEASGIIESGINLGDGNDIVTNAGTINGNIGDDDFTRGNDLINNSGIINGFVSLNSGNDTVMNSGTISAFITSLEGNNTIINSGTVSGIFGGTNDDEITNSGTVLGSISGAEGNDTISNTGNITTNLLGEVGIGGGRNRRCSAADNYIIARVSMNKIKGSRVCNKVITATTSNADVA